MVYNNTQGQGISSKLERKDKPDALTLNEGQIFCINPRNANQAALAPKTN